MIKQVERIETIAHLIIDKAAEVAASIIKAVVTLVCLGASVSYKAGVKAREIFDANYASVETVQETSKPINNDELVVEQVIAQEQQVSDVLEDAVITSELIIDELKYINIVRPVTKTNSLDAFIAEGLVDELANNLLEMTSYSLPSNKRVKSKTHIRHEDLGVLKQYYPVLVATGTLR